jgi:2-polyprenyl-6-methoxyphenol hydroxylase-like FAD-dependent oxidoreductase
MSIDYDVITIGGGLGGAALARMLAENGKRVLVVEREREFKDRIRGEAIGPWGVLELQKLGLYERLSEKCGHNQPYVNTIGMGPVRDLRTTTPQRLASLTFFHPAMQEVVLDAARAAGADIWRGWVAREVRPGAPPTVSVDRDGVVRNLTANLVVAADGRSSSARVWGKFNARRGSQKLFGAGALLENFPAADDTALFLINPDVGRAAFIFPQGNSLARAYLFYGDNLNRLQGEQDKARFVEESIKCGMPIEIYEGTRLRGPLASFDMTETWVDHPYRDGLALIGDAAGASDPTWGQGLSLTSRDVRVLAEKLLSANDWDVAAHSYAEDRDRYFGVTREVGQWFFDLFLSRGPEYDRLRERALPLLMSEPDRIPDHILSGPEMPFDEEVRKRFYGEI